MRPINKKFFGPGPDKIAVRFHNGTSVVDGYIVKQLGSTSYRVSDGTVEKDCSLVQAVADAAELYDNRCAIIVDTPNGEQVVTKLTAFKAYVTGPAPVVRWQGPSATGTVRRNEDVSPVSDTSPNQFAFTPVFSAVRGTNVESNSISITGLGSDAPISVVGGQYRVGAGAWVSTSGTISNGQTVRVRLTASSSFETLATATLTIGDKFANFSVTTEVGVLNPLTLATLLLPENTTSGQVISPIQSKTVGSTVTMIDDAGGRFAISNNNLVTGTTSFDYEADVSHTITLRETLAGASNSPRDTTVVIEVGNVFEQPNLAALALSASSISEASTAGTVVGAIQNKSNGSTLTLSNSAGGRFAISGTNIVRGSAALNHGTTAQHNISVVETLLDAENSPRTTILTISVLPASSDAVVSTIGEIQSIVNGTTPVVAGATILVAPGSYDTRALSFSGQPASVTWQAADAANRPVFTGWKIAPSNFAATGGNLKFSGINFDMPLPTLGTPGSTTGAIFWSPLPSTIHTIILGTGSSLDSLTIEDFDATGNMLPWHLGGRMTHNNPLVSLSGAKNFSLRRGTIRRTRAGVELNGVNGFVIEEVHFTEQHADPIVLQNGVAHCENGVIRNNHFTAPSGDTSNHHSDIIQLQPVAGSYQTRNIEVHGNTASGMSPVLIAQLDPSHAQVFPSIQGVSASAGNQTITLPTSPANGTIWAYMRTDASGNTCTVLPGGSNTLSSGASQTLSQNDAVIFTYNATSSQWAVEVTGQTFGQAIAQRWHAQELRLSVGTASFNIELPLAADGMRQYLFRCNTSAGGTVTFTLAGSDTYTEGALPVVTAAGQAPTFVSNGLDQWRPLPNGYRAWFVPRSNSFTLGTNERGLVTKLIAADGDITASLPVNGSGTYHIGREDGTNNVCKVAAQGGNTISVNGQTVSEITFVQGYGIDISGDGAGNWSATEQTPTYTFMFGNNGHYDNLRCFGNIAYVYGDFWRNEVAYKQAVFNNTILRLAFDDRNGDGVIGRYENNGGTQQNVLQLSGATAFGERNFGTGYLSLGGYAPYGGGATVPGLVKNNTLLGTANSNGIVAALSPYLNGTDRAFYRPFTRAEVIASARAKVGGALAGAFVGASGTDDTDGFYNFATGQVNTSILPRPIVSSTSPLSGATVGLDQSFQITFNTFIKAGSGNITLWNVTDNVAAETFNVATGLGSAGGAVTFTMDGFTINPFANLVAGKSYSVQVASTAIVSQAYGNTYQGVSDSTYLFVADAGVATTYTTLNADKGAYLTRTGALNSNASIKKVIFGFEARLVPNANAIHSLFRTDLTRDFNVDVVQSNGELRFTYGTSSWRVATAVPISGTTRKRVLVTVDTTQATINDGVKVYVDGVMATLTSPSWTQNTDIVGTGVSTVIRALSGANSPFNGQVGFIYFHALADADALPNLADSAVRAKFDPGQIGANGQGPTGSTPLFYKTGNEAAWDGATNLGSLTGFAKTGTFSNPTSEAVTFGSLTPSGTGAWKKSGSSAASTTLTGANADHFSMSASGVLTPTASYVSAPQPSYALASTIDGLPVNLNISTVANAYTVSSDAQADALDWANMSGKRVLFRGPNKGGPVEYRIVRENAGACSVNWWNSRSWTETVTCDAADVTDKPVWLVADGGQGVMWAIHMVLINKLRWTNLRIHGKWYPGDTQFGNNGGVATDKGSTATQPMIWLRNNVGDFEVDHCELWGNLRDYPIEPRQLAFYGVLGYTSGSSIVGHFNFHHNVAHGCRRLLTVPQGTDTGFTTIEHNEFRDFGGDAITFTKLKNTLLRWNYFHSPFTYIGDPGHGDFVQSVYNGTENLTNFEAYGNIMVAYRGDGIAAKSEFQGFYFDDIVAPGQFVGFKLYNNLIVSPMGHAMITNRGRNNCWWRNTCVRDVNDLAGISSGAPWIDDGSLANSSDNLIHSNFASNIFADGLDSLAANNLAVVSGIPAYEANFVGAGGSWRPTNREEALAMFAPKQGSEIATKSIGAIGPYIDWDAKTVDTTGAPWLDVVTPTLTNVSATPGNSNSVVVTATPSKLTGRLYHYVGTSAVEPSAADLKAGTGAVGAGSQLISTPGVKNASVIGLSPLTTYYAYLLHRDWNGNESIIYSSSFTTPEADNTESFLGSKVHTYSSTSSQNVSLADLKDKDGSNVVLAPGDMVVLNVCFGSTGNTTSANCLMTGYTAAHTQTWHNNGRDTNQLVQYKFMGVTPDANVLLKTYSAPLGVSVTIYALRGIDPNNPIDVVATATGTNTSPNPPAITPTVDEPIILVCGAAAASPGNAGSLSQSTGTSTIPNTFVAARETLATQTNTRAATALYFDWEGGVYDPEPFIDSVGDTSGSWSGVTLSLRRNVI